MLVGWPQSSSSIVVAKSNEQNRAIASRHPGDFQLAHRISGPPEPA
jgi:hypothetical protein